MRCLTTICEEWNRKKIAVLTEAGYQVEVLWDREKVISGSNIRAAIMRDDESWRPLVPVQVAEALDSLDIASRLRRLRMHPTG